MKGNRPASAKGGSYAIQYHDPGDWDDSKAPQEEEKVQRKLTVKNVFNELFVDDDELALTDRKKLEDQQLPRKE